MIFLNKKNFDKFFYKVLVAIWCIVIFLFSNTPAVESTKQSSGFIKGSIVFICTIGQKIGFVRQIPSGPSLDIICDYLEVPVRKCAHASIYFILALLVMLELKKNTDFKIEKLCFIAIIFCAIYSMTDEFHQLLVPGRSGEIRDCLIDTMGACYAVALVLIINKLKKSK